MLRRSLLVLATVASMALLAPNVASARGGFGGGHFGGGHFGGGGWHGGYGRGFGYGIGAFGLGVGLGYGLYGPYGPYGYYGSPYYYGGYEGYYDDDGGCYLVRRRIHTRYGWRIRPVEICR